MMYNYIYIYSEYYQIDFYTIQIMYNYIFAVPSAGNIGFSELSRLADEIQFGYTDNHFEFCVRTFLNLISHRS